MATLPPASARALATPELLELILAALPPRDLLLAQRTCKTWQTIISTSPTLQNLLFFRPQKIQIPSTNQYHTNTTSYTLNPFIQSAFPFLLEPDRLLSDAEVEDWDLKFGHLDDPPPPTLRMNDMPQIFKHSSWNLNPAAFKRKEASWRRMHVSNPPVKRVVFERISSGMMGTCVQEVVVKFGEYAEADVRREEREKKDFNGKVVEGPSWIKLDDEEMRLKEVDGLTAGVLYDYLYGEICTGDIPNRGTSDIKFSRQYPLPKKQKKLQGGETVFGDVFRDAAEAGVGSGEGEAEDGITLIVSLAWAHGCMPEHDEEFPQFESEAYKRVKVGPWVETDFVVWD